MRTRCCHSFLAFLLKFLNFLQTFLGISIIVYSVYLLNQWNTHSTTHHPLAPSPDHPDALLSGLSGGFNLHLDKLPAPWFIYAFMGLGVVVCCITCIGQIAAEAVNGCCLCSYTFLTSVLLIMEGALVSFMALDHQWEKDLPFDPTGELDRLRVFVEDNIDVCQWVGIIVIVVQVLSLLFAMILRGMVSTRDDDIEGDYDSVRSRAWEPLLHPHFSPTSGSVRADSKGIHSDIWSSRLREKYGLHGGDSNAALTLNSNR